MNQEELKKQVGIEAAKYVSNGMTVGLGTGSTVTYLVDELARKMREEGLAITGVSTSNATTRQASELGIPLKSVDEVEFIDVTIDGADEVSKEFYGIKGGGGALLYEKIVASYSKKYFWIIDESKQVDKLGAFPLPVEVVTLGADQLFRVFEAKGYAPKFRCSESSNERFLTDNQNFIIDLHLTKIQDPLSLSRELSGMVGVIEHGLFLNMVDTVIVGVDHGVQTYHTVKI